MKKPVTQFSPKKIPSPKQRSAEDAYFDREMCQFYWGQDYIRDVTGVDKNVSGHFIEVLHKLRRIVEHTSGNPSLTDSAENAIDGFRLQSL